MHGSLQYPKLASDPAGFDMQHSSNGIKGHALYVGASDHVPSDYNRGLPTGSAVIGLLLTKSSAGCGAYELFHHGSNAYQNPSQAVFDSHQDTIAIRDQFLWLPLGLAVAV